MGMREGISRGDLMEQSYAQTNESGADVTGLRLLFRLTTAGFSEHDPHWMMHVCDLDERFARLAGVTSTCGQVSIDATRCRRTETLLLCRMYGIPGLLAHALE